MRASMTRNCVTVLFAMNVVATARGAQDGAHVYAALSALNDNNRNGSYAASVTLAPSRRWSLTAGGGRTRLGGDSHATALVGSSYHGGVDVVVGSFGLSSGYGKWSDSDGLSSQVPKLSLLWRRSGLQLQILAEQPRFALDYLVRSGTQPAPRQFAFGGRGLGAGVDYLGTQWGVYFSGMRYQYGNEIARLQSILLGPNLLRFPRLALLADSYAKLAQGAQQSNWQAGVERYYSRVTWRFDFAQQTDALFAITSRSVSLGANVPLSKHVSIDTSLGTNRADGSGNTLFGGVVLGLSW